MTRPGKCLSCEGTTWQIVTEPSTMYACGTRNVAVRCAVCGGTGLAAPPAGPDHKTLAAGA